MTITYQSYVPGAIGRLLALQIETYAPALGFGRAFETKVGAAMAEFLARFDPARDLFLTAMAGTRVAGGITIDRGESDRREGLAHLRWFIVDERYRGQGVGQTLLTRAVQFARAHGDWGIYLWTVDELPAARRLYDRAGFVVVEEMRAETWGRPITEQRLELRF